MKASNSFGPILPGRRTLLQTAACGFGSLAFRGLLQDQAAASPLSSGVASPAGHPSAQFPPRARRVIFLFLQGGPSQPDLFDPKPFITKMHGQKIAPGANEHKLSVGVDRYLALKSVAPIRPRGQCGMLMSDLLPHLSTVADDICLLRGMHTDSEAHAPATLQLHTGASIDVRPSMGAWFSYGLGSENQNLPGFLTIQPDSDVRTYGPGFLPAQHQGTPVSITSSARDSAIRYLEDAETPPAIQRRRLDLIQKMNHRLSQRVASDAQMDGMMESFELAFRMQAETPALIDLSKEPKSIQDLYGVGNPKTDKNARACLLARRMSEAGVRFVQVTIGGWDHHGNIREALPGSCAGSDQPVAALLKDLKLRGMLEDTLVVWSGEFGRTSWSQDLSGTSPIDTHGREHQPEGYCAWMAGAGVRAGLTWGSTDDFGFRAIDGKVHLHDLHATMLNLLGINHTQLTYRHAGRDYRLTDVFGRVVTEILT
jgi:hypothetical protein